MGHFQPPVETCNVLQCQINMNLAFFISLRMVLKYSHLGTVQPLYRITKRRQSSAQEKLAKQRKRLLSLTHSTEVNLQAHLEQLIDVITETTHRHVTYGLFAQHQMTFSFLLCCNIMKYSKDQDTGRPLIEKNDWSLFIRGASCPKFGEGLMSAGEDKKSGIYPVLVITECFITGHALDKFPRRQSKKVKYLILNLLIQQGMNNMFRVDKNSLEQRLLPALSLSQGSSTKTTAVMI